jgi:hypothetical protein
MLSSRVGKIVSILPEMSLVNHKFSFLKKIHLVLTLIFLILLETHFFLQKDIV